MTSWPSLLPRGTSSSTSFDSWTRSFRFEHFLAGPLRAMGYRASATVAVGDGGVDVIASRDALGIEPPVIKVQCKRIATTIGAPLVQTLVGALAHGGSELGVFVTLGAYSSDALHIERTRQDLRLINGTQLVDLIFEHYDSPTQSGSASFPCAAVYAVDPTLVARGPVELPTPSPHRR